MTKRTGVARARLARLGGAALLCVTLILGGGTVSSARPSHADLEAAKAKLNDLNRHLDLLVEQYDQARIKLRSAQEKLVNARKEAARAESEHRAAQQLLSARAAAAYEGTGSALEALLGATSLSDFTDRLEFVNSVAQQDADAANQAAIKGQEAIRARQRLNTAIAEQQKVLGDLRAKTSEIKGSIAQQQDLVSQLEKELAKPIYPKPTKPSTPTVERSPSNPHPPSPPPTPGPQPPSGGAAIAVAAAYSVIGVPYKWGGSDPEHGFDCSGLTMWAWAQAGVSLPHSSAGQYAMLPHVSRDQLQPGDLVFFYTPISHVGIYVGGGMMIHSPHTGSYVQEVSLDSEPDYVGAGRPG